MPVSPKNEQPDVSSDLQRLSINVYWNADLARWDTVDKNKDSFVVDIINDLSETGYISFKRAPATAGEPIFAEVFKVDKDGNAIVAGYTEWGPGVPGAVGKFRIIVTGGKLEIQECTGAGWATYTWQGRWG